MQSQTTLAFLIYISITLLLGFLAFKRTKNISDYILGGRKLGSVVAALSAGASDMSGWLLLGLPGYAYAAGFEAGWIGLGLLAGTYCNWSIVAKRLRRYSEIAGNSITLPTFFENRFHDKSHLLRIISACFILLFFLFYTSSGLVAGGKLFNTVFEIPYNWAVGVGALAILLYTVVGGFLAVSWTDVIQSLLMLFALIMVPIAAINYVGGWGATYTKMESLNPELLTFFTGSNGKPLSFMAILSLLGWGLGYFGQPHILARFKAINSPGNIPAARRIAVSWSFLTMGGALFVGFAGIGYLGGALQGAETEKIFMILVKTMFHPLLAGVLLAAILAAIMSTADSQLLVSSSALTEDLYRILRKKGPDSKELVIIGRIAVFTIALIAYLLALKPDSKVLDLVAYAWAGFGAAFGPTLILSLYWSNMTRNGALAGILTGGLTVVIWKQLSGGIFDLYEIVPGFVFSFLSIIIVSLLSRQKNPIIHAEFEDALRR